MGWFPTLYWNISPENSQFGQPSKQPIPTLRNRAETWIATDATMGNCPLKTNKANNSPGYLIGNQHKLLLDMTPHLNDVLSVSRQTNLTKGIPKSHAQLYEVRSNLLVDYCHLEGTWDEPSKFPPNRGTNPKLPMFLWGDLDHFDCGSQVNFNGSGPFGGYHGDHSYSPTT